MPPVLHIAFLKLTASTAQEVFPYKLWLGVDEGHHVLQLVTEAEGAS
jgi:hypothetical protein